MTRQQDYTATIKTKRCKGTGLTEDIARELHARPGRRIMAIVELKVDDAHNRVDAPDHVDMTIEQIEPAMLPDFEDHLRELTRTVFQNRALQSDEDQLAIETQGDVSRPLDQVIEDGKVLVDPDLEDRLAAAEAAAADDDSDDPAFEPHPFDGREGYACAVCDLPEDTGIHTTTDAPQTSDGASVHEEDPVPA